MVVVVVDPVAAAASSSSSINCLKIVCYLKMHSRNSCTVPLSVSTYVQAQQLDKIITNGNDDTG